MPSRPLSRICNKCRRRYQGRSCPDCTKVRESPAKRGYDATWRKVRAEVLEHAGIPKEQWKLYDVDHSPAYDKEIEPDHRRYTLTPMLKVYHASKTAKEDVKRDHKGRITGKA